MVRKCLLWVFTQLSILDRPTPLSMKLMLVLIMSSERPLLCRYKITTFPVTCKRNFLVNYRICECVVLRVVRCTARSKPGLIKVIFNCHIWEVKEWTWLQEEVEPKVQLVPISRTFSVFHLSWLPSQVRAFQAELSGGHDCSRLKRAFFPGCDHRGRMWG